jgi:hypothetical protein
VSSVSGRLESPVIKAAGALAGVAAGLRALKGNSKTVIVEKEVRKKGGRFGLFK